MILSYGTNFLTFSSWNTFGAIQVSQSDYFKNIMERNKEYKKNILLEKLEEFNLSKEWVEEYEKNLGKISYTDRLKEKYRNIKMI